MPELRPHQVVSRNWLAARSRAYLADEPRVGKTPAAIMAARDVGAQRVLVVCPAIVVANWQHEWHRWWPDFAGTVTVMSYDRLVRSGAPDHLPDLVILDEAHYCKTLSAKRTKAALSMARIAPRAWLLSGTPMPNHPGELFPVLAALWPERLETIPARTYYDWLDATCDWQRVSVSMYTTRERVTGVRNPQLVRDTLAPIMLSRTFAEVAGGTEPIWWSEQFIPPTREVLTTIAEFFAKEGTNAEALLSAIEAGRRPTGQSLPTLRRLIGTAKAPLVAEMLLEELEAAPGRKLFVVAYHRDVIETLAAALRGVVIHGGTGPAMRVKAQERFRDDPTVQVLVGQTTAAGTGITLATADEVVMVEMDWVPGNNTQVAMRASLPGKGPVPVRVISLADTVDELVSGVLVRKERMQAAVRP